MLKISLIRRDGETQSRAEICERTVQEYAEALRDPNRVFPPVIVYNDGVDHWLADGFHRVAAWELIGRAEVPVDIRQGDRRAAILHACAANAAHGLRRTSADKRRAVTILLQDAEWSKWSNREIARRCGVSDALVRDVRGSICEKNADGGMRTVERNGTTYTQDTTKIGTTRNSKTGTTPDRVHPELETSDADDAETQIVDAAVGTETSVGGQNKCKPFENEPEPCPNGSAVLTPTRYAAEIAELRANCEKVAVENAELKRENSALKEQIRVLSSENTGQEINALLEQLNAAKLERDEALRRTECQDCPHRQAEKATEIGL